MTDTATPQSAPEAVTSAGRTSAALMILASIAIGALLARMAAAGASNLHPAHALRVIEAIRVELGRYYGTIALINVGLGVATALVMWALKVPNPWLWGATAGVLNFIPYVGCRFGKSGWRRRGCGGWGPAGRPRRHRVSQSDLTGNTRG